MPSKMRFLQDLTRVLTGYEAQADIRIQILRPRDLLNIEVLGFGVDLDDEATLRAGDKPGRLEYRFSYQHVGEQAWPHDQANNPPTIPTEALAARPSRLVYRVPAGESIPFTVEGLLAAMTRLTLIVTPVATPAKQPTISGKPFHTLPNGLSLYRVDGKMMVAPSKRTATSNPMSASVALHTARKLLATESAQLAASASHGEHLVSSGLFVRPEKLRLGRKTAPREPHPWETSLEVPFRLVLSPSPLEGFTHAMAPVGHPNAAHHVELWHTRLGVRSAQPDGSVVIDERAGAQKIVRAVWARDKTIYKDLQAIPTDGPFLMSINPRQRVVLVRQSGDPTIVSKEGKPITPEPVDVNRLYLSSLGAWLDVHGEWDYAPYSDRGLASIVSWEHRAVMGRDAYVKVVEPGYLYPLGHKAVKITITERKILDVPGRDPQAQLYQRSFLVVTEPVRTYAPIGAGRRFPFAAVRLEPLVTPDLDSQPTGQWIGPLEFDLVGGQDNTPPPHAEPGSGDREPGQSDSPPPDPFWPVVGGQPFQFTLHCMDRGGNDVTLSAPLLFVFAGYNNPQTVTSHYAQHDEISGQGQPIAFATPETPGDTTLQTQSLTLEGSPGPLASEPYLNQAMVEVPAVQAMSTPTTAVAMKYAKVWLDHDFDSEQNPGEVFVAFSSQVKAEFPNTGSSGGLIRPDLPGGGLSRARGLVGDNLDDIAKGTFKPVEFLNGAMPKLFGLFDLADVLSVGGLGQMPQFVAQSFGPVATLQDGARELAQAVLDAVARLKEDATRLPEPHRSAAQAGVVALSPLAGPMTMAEQDLRQALEQLVKFPDTALDAATTAVANLTAVLVQLDGALDGLSLPAVTMSSLRRPLATIQPLLESEISALLRAFAVGVEAATRREIRYTWRPKMKSWPETDPVFVVDEDGFTLDMRMTVGDADSQTTTEMAAELRDFSLILPPKNTLTTMKFARLAFRSATGRKPDVDVVFNEQTFDGVLGFIDTLRQMIPLDGFSDPPYLDVTEQGVTAGFDLALPNVSVGMFSLENISLGANCTVPFVQGAVSVGFNFCSREKPFRLTVMMIAGGGFVGITLTPQELVLLEMSLEAGANLALDFGVASGSVSAMVGIYLRLEDSKGSLTGYLRIRGEVDVLGMISASLTLELSLTYEFSTGKMIGRASMTVEVEVLFFSASVEITCERRFAGSQGDPTLCQMLGLEPADTDNDYWKQYCEAFEGGVQ